MKPIFSKLSTASVSIGSAGLLACFSLPLNAGNLSDQDFGNETQNIMGDAIQVVCGKFVANSKLPPEQSIDLSPDQANLFTRCGEMVHSANELEDDGNTDLSLGLSQSELGDALQQIGHDEVAVQEKWANETSNTQLQNIQSRMQELQKGASGFSTRSIFLKQGDELYALDDLLGQPTGGNAGEQSTNNWGAFINGTIGSGDRDSSTRESGFEFDSTGITAGLDYRLSSSSVLGIAFGYADAESTMDNNGGDQNVDGYNVILYGLYDTEHWYFNGSAGLGYYDYNSVRNIRYEGVDTISKADTEGDQYFLNALVGYQSNHQAWNYGTQLRLSYIDASIDAYTEEGGANPELNLAVNDQDFTSFQSVLGIRGSYASGHSFGVISPYISLDWHHEYESDSRGLTARYVQDPFNTFFTIITDDPDDDFYNLALGITFVGKAGQLFFDYQTPLDLDKVTNNIYTLGGRIAF